jgi:hypothetical protein
MLPVPGSGFPGFSFRFFTAPPLLPGATGFRVLRGSRFGARHSVRARFWGSRFQGSRAGSSAGVRGVGAYTLAAQDAARNCRAGAGTRTLPVPGFRVQGSPGSRSGFFPAPPLLPGATGFRVLRGSRFGARHSVRARFWGSRFQGSRAGSSAGVRGVGAYTLAAQDAARNCRAGAGTRMLPVPGSGSPGSRSGFFTAPPLLPGATGFRVRGSRFGARHSVRARFWGSRFQGSRAGSSAGVRGVGAYTLAAQDAARNRRAGAGTRTLAVPAFRVQGSPGSRSGFFTAPPLLPGATGFRVLRGSRFGARAVLGFQVPRFAG